MKSIQRLVLVCLGTLVVQLAIAQTQPTTTPSNKTSLRPFLGAQGDSPTSTDLNDLLPRWKSAPADRIYDSIDGKHLVGYVNDLTGIAYRYRDSGHQFWGRFIGFPPHVEAEEWTLAQFNKIGLADVHGETLNLPPQWNAKSWQISASGMGKNLSIETAYPAQYSPGTPAQGLDLELFYAGFGTEADYHGTDVHGKAVVLFSIPLPAVISGSAGLEDAIRRARSKGAGAIVQVVMLPGNVRGQISAGQGAGSAPVFSLGMEEGYALRDLIGECAAVQPAHLKIRMEVEEVPNLKTAIIFGTLPGTTDEKVYILAHLDSWFQGATDNGSGVATMLGLAEYFSRIPKAKRRRTVVFVGSPGHHNGKTWAAEWLKERKVPLEKTALVINAEHTSAQGTHLYGWKLEKTNVPDPNNWYVGGSAKFKGMVMSALGDFGVAMYHQPMGVAPGEMSPIYQLVPASIQVMNTNPTYFHSDHDDVVPYNQLEAVTRAYAKIITESDKISIADMQGDAVKKAGNISSAR